MLCGVAGFDVMGLCDMNVWCVVVRYAVSSSRWHDSMYVT